MDIYKRVMVFCWDAYESQGGLNDYINDFDIKEEAISLALTLKNSYDAVEIFDRIEGVIIKFN